MPHVYAVIGGGEWGPRLAAKALLEAVYVKPWSHVTVVDLAVAAEMHRAQGLEEVGVCWHSGILDSVHSAFFVYMVCMWRL